MEKAIIDLLEKEHKIRVRSSFRLLEVKEKAKDDPIIKFILDDTADDDGDTKHDLTYTDYTLKNGDLVIVFTKESFNDLEEVLDDNDLLPGKKDFTVEIFKEIKVSKEVSVQAFDEKGACAKAEDEYGEDYNSLGEYEKEDYEHYDNIDTEYEATED